MRAGFGRRFGFEVAFIVLVAVVAALRHASAVAIVLVMAAAWLAVSLLEWLLSRRAANAAPSVAEVAFRHDESTSVGITPHVRVIEPNTEFAFTSDAHDLEEPVRREAWPEPGADVEAEHEPEPVPVPSAREHKEAVQREPWPEPEAEPEPAAEPEPVEAEAEPEPEPVAAEPEPEPEPEEEPIEAEAEPEPEPEDEPEPVPAEAGPAEGPHQWNVWELDRLSRAVAGDDLVKDEERAYLLVYLRDFASPDGLLPEDFDLLVRESFGDLLAVPSGA